MTSSWYTIFFNVVTCSTVHVQYSRIEGLIFFLFYCPIGVCLKFHKFILLTPITNNLSLPYTVAAMLSCSPFQSF